MSDYNIDNAKNDIENLQDQNSYDFQEIKRLDRLIKDYDKRVLQAINMNNQINKRIQDDYEEFKKTVMDGNLLPGNGGSIRIVDNLNSTSTTSCLSANQGRVIKSSLDAINTRIDNLELGNGGIDENTTVILNKKIEEIQTNVSEQLDNITSRIDGLELGGNIVLRDIVEGEIFILDTATTPTVTYGNIVLSNNDLSVNENDNATFTVKLDKQPTNNQIVNISINNSYCSIKPSSLTFNSSNYSNTQTVTVTGVHDSSNYTNKSSVITLSSSNVTSKTVNVTINNIDSQPSQPDNPPSETISVQSITLNKNEITLNVGESEQLSVIFNPTNATNQNVNWSSNNGNCSVVGGLVTAIAEGECIITCTTEDQNKTAECIINVEAEEQTNDKDYTTSNLICYLEGKDKGNISTDELTWYDISGNGNDLKLQYSNGDKQYIWHSNGVYADGLRGTGVYTKAYITATEKLKEGEFTEEFVITIKNTTNFKFLDKGYSLSINNGNTFVTSGTLSGHYINKQVKNLSDGNKHHIVWVSNSSSSKLYIDGVLEVEANANGLLNMTATEFIFTLSTTSILHLFRHYNRSLSIDEINKNYHQAM